METGPAGDPDCRCEAAAGKSKERQMSTELRSLPKSKVIRGFQWTGERLGYGDPEVKGDTFPMTWADDDHIYASAGDPLWGETKDGLDVERFAGGPTDYKIEKIDPMNDYRGWGGDGVKPSGMICVGSVLYLAFQNLRKLGRPAPRQATQHRPDAHKH
jgi:hypothetical protein